MQTTAKKRILAIDYGKARIGMAISDEMKIIAQVLPTLSGEKSAELSAEKVIKELKKLEDNSYFVEEVVVGLPLRLNGSQGSLGGEVLRFSELLKEKLNIKITTWDERLTTVQAERSMLEAKMSRKKRAKKVDSVTALIILQSFLDSRI